MLPGRSPVLTHSSLMEFSRRADVFVTVQFVGSRYWYVNEMENLCELPMFVLVFTKELFLVFTGYDLELNIDSSCTGNKMFGFGTSKQLGSAASK